MQASNRRLYSHVCVRVSTHRATHTHVRYSVHAIVLIYTTDDVVYYCLWLDVYLCSRAPHNQPRHLHFSWTTISSECTFVVRSTHPNRIRIAKTHSTQANRLQWPLWTWIHWRLSLRNCPFRRSSRYRMVSLFIQKTIRTLIHELTRCSTLQTTYGAKSCFLY